MDARKILESKAEDKKEIACYRGTTLRFLNNIVSIYRARRVEEKLISRRFRLKSEIEILSNLTLNIFLFSSFSLNMDSRRIKWPVSVDFIKIYDLPLSKRNAFFILLAVVKFHFHREFK